MVECAKVFNLCLHDPILRNQTANLGDRQAGGHDHPQTGWGEGVAAHRPRPLMPSIAKRGGSKEGRRALLIVAGRSMDVNNFHAKIRVAFAVRNQLEQLTKSSANSVVM